MIILIAPENDVAKELEILDTLFKQGLEYYHLRKPNKSKEEHVHYLQEIDPAYHSKIIIHYHHKLINKFDLKGIHFQEQKRRDVLENGVNYLSNYNLKGKLISSSFHEPKDLENCKIKFDYHLLSPVFSSISKEGYKGRGFDVNHIDKPIIGMGGVNKETVPEVLKLGYNGIGVLGGVWNSKNPVENFKSIKNQFEFSS